MNSRIRNMQGLFSKLFKVEEVIGSLKAFITTMGLNVTDLDADLSRIMKDHWVNSADGKPLPDDFLSPLELIGSLLDIPEEKWEKNDSEAYRTRLLIISKILMKGLTTPRAILSLTATVLGCELYPNIQRIKDTSIGWALKPGTNKKYELLNEKGYTFFIGNPPEINNKIFDITLTDNPVKNNVIVFNNLQNKQFFRIKSGSFAIDLPEITITVAGDGPLKYPAIENYTTKEIIFFSVELQKNDSLTVQPRIEQEIIDQFNSYENIHHHSWKSNYRNGSAYLKTGNELIDISDKVFYIKNYAAFDEAAFSIDSKVPIFPVRENVIKTPKVIPGESKWRFRTSSTGQGNVTLSWWMRHSASFKIKIPRNEYINRVEIEGRIDLLKKIIERARPAGVLAYIDLPYPIGVEYHAIDEKFNVSLKSG